MPQTSTNNPADLQDYSNGMQLSSIPWMDVLNMHTDGPFEPEDSFITNPPSPQDWRTGFQDDQNNHQLNTSSHKDLFVNDGGLLTIPLHVPGPMLTSDAQREVCIQKLSDLGASLMKNLNRLSTCSLSTSFIFTPSNRNAEEYLFRAMDGSTPQDNAIGKVLHSTEEFLKILQNFRHSLLDLPPLSNYQEENESDHNQQSTYTTESMRELNGGDEMLRRWNMLHAYKDRPQKFDDSHGIHAISSPVVGQPIRLSIPSNLTILTCYICILKSFENIFVSLGYWLSVPASSPLHAKVAPVIAGVQVNGFTLDSYSHRSLQLRILVEVCDHMLDNMEKALWFDQDSIAGESTVLADSVFREMLQVSLKREGLDSADNEDNVTGMKKVRNLLMKIKAGLK